MSFEKVSTALGGVLSQLRRKRVRYWLIVLIFILLGMLIGPWLEKEEVGIVWRYSVSQWLQRKLTPRQAYAQRTVVVLIGDEEYWKGELASRAPIKRSYLAKLVLALDAADPAIIAIDFDLSSPVPDGSIVEHLDYQAETKEFLETVKTVSHNPNRTIVLPETLGPEDGGAYTMDSDIHNGFDFGGGRVRMGYIALPYDMRRVPLSVRIEGGKETDSFSQAIVRSYSRGALQRVSGDGSVPPFGTYLKPEDFDTLTADQVLNGDPNQLKESLAHKIVIVGGNWHALAYDRGPESDSHVTPVGAIGGAFIHANYVEALLDLRTYGSWTESILLGIEVLVGLSVALIFAIDVKRWWVKLGVLVMLSFGLVAFSFVSWTILGLFFDFLVPLVLLFGKFGIEQVLHWRAKAREYQRQEGAGQ